MSIEKKAGLGLKNADDEARDWQIMTASLSHFPPTSRTMIERIQQSEGKERLVWETRFATLYYPAIYSYARRLGLGIEDAEDRVQDFFVKVAEVNLLSKFDMKRETKFRYWLMACFKHLVLKHHARENSDKRGGRNKFVSFDSDFAEKCFQSINAVRFSVESAVDLTFAVSLWHQVVEDLVEKHRGTSKEIMVRELLPLTLLENWPAAPAATQEEMAGRYGVRPANLKAFFNRNLKANAKKRFWALAADCHPGVTGEEILHFWHLLRVKAG